MRERYNIILRLILTCGIILGLILMVMLFLLPSNDYMKQTFSEKIKSGHSPKITINGDSIGGCYSSGEWCTLLENQIETSTNQSIEVTNISKPGNSSFAGIVSWEMMEPT